MKISLYCWLIVGCTTLANADIASGQNILEKRLSITIQEGTLEHALEIVRENAGVSVYYNPAIAAKLVITEKKFTNEKLAVILQALLRNSGLSFARDEQKIIIKPVLPKRVVPKPGTLAGQVIDEQTGESLPGATIMVKNTASNTVTDVDGRYTLALEPGTYEVEFRFVGYHPQVITGVVIDPGALITLDIAMKGEVSKLGEVVITASFEQASVNGMLAKQKNSAVVSSGISAEQISATPDKHIGETLKRISGVSTNDNRKVVVRGIAERYNIATLDGSTLPSTDVQERDFEFNLIPSNLVESVVVSKSLTPDMTQGFAGGRVQINTKSVPTTNFLSLSMGLSYNSRTIGKDFLGYQRGKHDYIGFDDGARDHFPDGIFNLSNKYNPQAPLNQNEIQPAQIGEQNKRIGGTERLGTRTYEAKPSQNYQLSGGRIYSLSKTKVRDLGFVGSLSYRNTQSNDYIADMRRGGWAQKPANYKDPDDKNYGNVYGFNTTIGVLLNGGFKTERHQLKTNNLYTHIYDDRFSRLIGWTFVGPKDDDLAKFPTIEEDDRPKFSDLLQNKLSGIHQFGPVKVEWNASRAKLETLEQDAVSAGLKSRNMANYAPLFYYQPSQASDPGVGGLHRDQYMFEERNLSADISVAVDVTLGKTTHTFKTGANYLGKHAWYDWNILPIVTKEVNVFTPYRTIPIQEWGDHMTMEDPDSSLFYFPGFASQNRFEAKSVSQGAFIMTDSRLLPNLRIVGGVRAEYFKTDTIVNAASLNRDKNFKLYMDDSVRTYWLPSVSLTYTPLKNFNIRASYGESMVRPGLMENARFARYNPSLGTVLRSRGVVSTKIQNYDAKLEWFPGAGDVIATGYFYKYFDKPAEYYAYDQANTGQNDILITNSDWAKVHGWEFELRKNLGFLYAGKSVLKNLYISGNLTLQTSTVRARVKHLKEKINGTDKDSVYFTYLKNPRPLYGQVPILYNAGVQYIGQRLGLNLVYNYTGYKTFVTGSSPEFLEYERPRGQLDAQVSYRMLKGKMEVKLSMSNLLDAPFRFFINENNTYGLKPGVDSQANLEWKDKYEYKEGFTEEFEEGYYDPETNQRVGDRKTLTRYTGRTFSFTISYNF